MRHTVSLWRIFAVLMLSLTMSSCVTAPITETAESVEIVVKPRAKTPRTAPVRPETQISGPKTWLDLKSLHDYEVLDHEHFVVYYDREYRLARWVKYELTKEEAAAKEAKRRNRFRPDPLLKTRGVLAAMPSEYRKTGYDQGHLAPSADFAFSQKANDQTFVMSNMVPQKPKLNRVAWRLLEDQVRKWACGEERITIATGPILEGEMDRLPGGLPVPREFFKAVFDETPPRKAIAFIYRQSDSTNVMHERMVSLKELDARTGENFEAYLEDDIRTPAQSLEWRECTP